MNKAQFLEPEIEVIKFSEVDAILTASTGGGSGSIGGRDPIDLPEL